MNIITLTSDYGTRDHDVAALKGDLMREIPGVQIVDISHDVTPFNIMEAAYLVQRSFMHFPEGSIHLILVNAEIEPSGLHLAGKVEDRYILAADNGLLSLVSPNVKYDPLVGIDLHNREEKSAREVFTMAAGHLLRKGEMSVLGTKPREVVTLQPSRPSLRSNHAGAIGHVVHIDNFGNLITNFTRKWLKEQSGGKKWVILVRNKRITRLVDRYLEGPSEGEFFGVFNSDDMLEIAVQRPSGRMRNSACGLLGLQVNDNVYIDFE